MARAERRPTSAPLPAARLPLFLATWQGIASTPDTPRNVERAVETIFGFPAPVELLESEYLAARIPDYRPTILDTWLASANLMWVGCGERRLALCPRDALPLFRDQSDGTAARTQPSTLLPAPIGRFTFSELLDHTGLTSFELTQRLWKAAWSGAITSDSFSPLRVGMRSRFRLQPAESSIKGGRRAAFRAWKASRSFDGCWFAVSQPDMPDDALEAAELDNDRARLVLDRYGIVFRELLDREMPALQWAAVFRALRRLEFAGEAVAGSFFDGIHGVQFAAPAAIHVSHSSVPENTMFWINATDPTSACGLGVEGLQESLPARLKSTRLIYQGSRLVAALRKSGKEWDLYVTVDDPSLTSCLNTIKSLPAADSNKRSGITVERVNSVAATKSEYLAALRNHFTVVTDARRITLYAQNAARA